MKSIEDLKRKGLIVTGDRVIREGGRVSSGIDELDRVAGGGLPRGAITEVVAPSCGGATVLYATLARATSGGGLAALVDPRDGFDADSAHAMGVGLERLLWVRPPGAFKQALQALERILSSGSFGLAALDLGMEAGRLPEVPAAWMRIKKLAAASKAVALVISAAPRAGPFASLLLSVRRRRVRWGGRVLKERWLAGIDLSFDLRRKK